MGVLRLLYYAYGRDRVRLIAGDARHSVYDHRWPDKSRTVRWRSWRERIEEIASWGWRQWWPVLCFGCWDLCSRIIVIWDGWRGWRCMGCLYLEDVERWEREKREAGE